jgi:hypothetical protein
VDAKAYDELRRVAGAAAWKRTDSARRLLIEHLSETSPAPTDGCAGALAGPGAPSQSGTGGDPLIAPPKFDDLAEGAE